jgi:DNA invertase Pin-like site-specific DNA recombinase
MDIAIYLIYSRISTDKQDNQNQLSQLRAFAPAQNWRIKREYIDIASGKNGDREQLKALFDSASRREYYHLHGRATPAARE